MLITPQDQGAKMFDTHVMVRPDMHGGHCFGISAALHALEAAGISHAGLIAACTDMNFAFLGEFCRQVRQISLYTRVTAWAGVELLNIPPALIRPAVAESRNCGAQIVLVHGESIMDAVEKGTNFAAIDAGVDILACPGMLDQAAADLAAERHVFVELSGSPRHAFANARTIAMCISSQVAIVCGSGASRAEELHSPELWSKIMEGADVSLDGSHPVLNAVRLGEKILMQRLQRSEQKN